MQHVISIDAAKCAGCRVCEMVCSMDHTGECNPERARIRVLLTEADGFIDNTPMTCMHCEKALCEAACPTGAIYRDSVTGARLTQPERCLGCRACVYACPAGASLFDWPQHIAVRCDLCGGEPLCARYCPTGALEYLRVDKLNARRMRQGAERLFQSEAPGLSRGEAQSSVAERPGQYARGG